MEKKIILASSSPRRKEILKKMGINFKIVPSNYDETLENYEFDYKKIENIAYKKAEDVFYQEKISSDILIISADTIVVLDNKILTKPYSYENALNILKSLSGRKHFVVTSICVLSSPDKYKIKSCTSYVEFNDIKESLIIDYIKEYKPFDKAGAYGIQELPKGFIKNIEGSYENIVGLCPKCLETLMLDICEVM